MNIKRLVPVLIILIVMSCSITSCGLKNAVKTTSDKSEEQLEKEAAFPDEKKLKNNTLLEKFSNINNFFYEYDIRYETFEAENVSSSQHPEVRYKVWYKDGKIKTEYFSLGNNFFYIFDPQSSHGFMYYPQQNKAVKFSTDSQQEENMPIKKQNLNPFIDIKNDIPLMKSNGTSVVNKTECDVFNYETQDIKATYYFSKDTGIPVRAEIKSDVSTNPFRYSLNFKEFKIGTVTESDVTLPANVEITVIESGTSDN